MKYYLISVLPEIVDSFLTYGLVGKAIERFVREEHEQFAFLKEGEDAIDRGDYLTHDEMVAEVRQWKLSRQRAA